MFYCTVIGVTNWVLVYWGLVVFSMVAGWESKPESEPIRVPHFRRSQSQKTCAESDSGPESFIISRQSIITSQTNMNPPPKKAYKAMELWKRRDAEMRKVEASFASRILSDIGDQK